MKVLIAAFLLFVVGACEHGTITEADPMWGSYNLSKIDGVLVAPWPPRDSTAVILLYDDMFVAADGTWRERAYYGTQSSYGHTSVQADSGRWTRTANVVSFTSFDASTHVYSGTFDSHGSPYGRPALLLRSGGGPLRFFEQLPYID